MMTMMMMQRLLQNNNNNNNNNNSNNNNNGYVDETRLNGIRHHSASPFSKPAAVQAAGTGTASDSGGEPDASQQQSSAAGSEQQPSACSITAATAVQTGTCATAGAMTTVRQQAADADDRLTSDEDDELNVDEDPVDLTNNRLHGCGQLLQSDNKACTAASATSVPMMMDTTASDYETCSSGAPSCNKGRLAFSVENILDPNKFTKKLIAPAAVLPRWRPRVDFTADSSIVGEFFFNFFNDTLLYSLNHF